MQTVVGWAITYVTELTIRGHRTWPHVCICRCIHWLAEGNHFELMQLPRPLHWLLGPRLGYADRSG